MRLAVNYQRVDPSKGGAETYVVDLCRSLIQAGHQVDLYAESWRDDVLPPEVRAVKVEAPGPSKLARIMAFGRNSETAMARGNHDCSVGFINTWSTDVLIPQGGVHGGSLEANSKRYPAGIRRSLYLLGKRLNPKFWAYRGIEARQFDLSRGTHYVAVSRMVMGHLQRFHDVPTSRIHVIPNAIDPDRLHVDQPAEVRSRLRGELGIAPDALVGLFVGHNFWLKGLKPLLHAMAQRKASRPDAKPLTLLVCGGGSLGPFRRMVKALGLEAEVRMLGFFPEIKACFWAADFFVSPTYYDPCSLVVFEALACGLPVITTACNGAGELITNGEQGYVISAPDALAEIGSAIDQMADPARRRTMAEKARRLGREQSFDNHVARLIDLFETVAATKRSKSASGPIGVRVKARSNPSLPSGEESTQPRKERSV